MWTPPSLRNPNDSPALQYTPQRVAKLGTISSAEKSRTSFNTSSLTDSSAYIQDEIFDIMPKTDYTYSRSGSYSRTRMNDIYESPNMSRRRIRGSLIQTSYTDDTMDVNDGFSDSGEEDGNMAEDTERVYEYKTVLDKNGIELRSGKNLHGLRSILSGYDVRSRHSLASDTVTSSNVISSQGSLPLRSDRSANISHSSRTNRSTNVYSNQGSRLSDGTVNMYSKDASRSLMSEKSLRTIRKTLVEEFEEVEKGSMESDQSEKISTRSRRSGRSKNSINHLYGLDSEEEFSETDSSLNTKRSSSTNGSASVSDSQSSLTTVTTTVVTTIIETVTTFTKPIVAPVWNYVGRPVWVAVGQPVVATVTAMGRWLWSVMEYMMLQFILVDVWMLSRARAGRLCCCLFLPLLLLLPLLLAGSSLWSSTGSFLPFGIFATRNDTFVNTIPAGQINMYSLNEEVKRIVIQLQQGSGNQLDVTQVEAIVRNVVGEELAALKLQMTEDKNKDTTDEWKLKMDQAEKLAALQNQIAALKGNIENLEVKLSTDKDQYILDRERSKGSLSGSIGDLEEQLSVLRVGLQNLELSHQALALRMNNCCRNDSFLNGAIEDQVNMILGQMMAGQTSGHPGQDAFTAWLHSNYVSKQDLDQILAALAADITQNILAKTKESSSHNTEVFIAGNGSALSETYVKSIVEAALLRYGADKTGMADYALESAGGSVISTRCSETYYRKTALVSIFGIPLWYASNSPRTVIQPEVHPGQCWAFRGTQGYLVIQLSTVVMPTAFSLEHIPKSLAPSGNIDSAPRDIAVYGIVNERETEGVSLGNYTYNQDGKPIQYFPVQVPKPGAFQLIELRILRNHGNMEFTCLYRFRVHGVPYRK